MNKHEVEIKRYIVKVAGESGQGINSIGEVLARSIKNSGYFTFGYREYPSLIKGGYASYQIDFSDFPINSSSSHSNLLICLSRLSVHKYLKTLMYGGNLIHCLPSLVFTEDEKDFIKRNAIQVKFIDAFHIVASKGGRKILANTVMLGITGILLKLNPEIIKEILKDEFKDKVDVLKLNMEFLDLGYEIGGQLELNSFLGELAQNLNQRDSYIMTGNHALVLGAVAAGVRAYYSYPMTPTSSILEYFSETYKETGVLVKQVEDEITAAQMAIGSMFMGTRALTGTSGGGFDLMTESVSLAGMTETPSVFILGQRPGPATGLPTWTAQGDLNLAIYSAHGEYPKCVIAVSDLETCYTLIQQAFNIAERFQIPVILLTDKQVAEASFNISKLPKNVEIKRYLVDERDLDKVKSEDRYRYTPTGVSKRWLPGQTDSTYDANSDEHLEDGTLTEEGDPSKFMMEKRMRKMQTMLEVLPEPTLYGPEKADISFVGWGSVKHPILDTMKLLKENNVPLHINYLHYEYIYPVKTKFFMEFVRENKRIVLIENNYMGQLGALLTQNTGYMFKEKFLKYDGRPFFLEDLIDYLGFKLTNKNLKVVESGLHLNI